MPSEQWHGAFMKGYGWLLVMLPLLVACESSSGGSSASCVGPYLDDQPPSGHYGAPSPTVAPGDTITIYGHWYTSTCNDTGGNAPLEPLPQVQLTLRVPGGNVEGLGRFAPGGRDMGFTASVHIPAFTRSGTATISDERAHPATYQFTVGAP